MAIVLDNITYTYGVGTPLKRLHFVVYLLPLKMGSF